MPQLSAVTDEESVDEQFAAPGKLGGHFPRRGRRAARDQFIANEIEHAALNIGQFIHI